MEKQKVKEMKSIETKEPKFRNLLDVQKRFPDEQIRYNSRQINDTQRFAFALTKCEGRLTYKELTNAQ